MTGRGTPSDPDQPGRLLIAGGRVMTPRGWRRADVLLEGGKIGSVEAPPPRTGGTARTGASAVTGADVPVDASGLMVVPGFIDLQVNRAFGHDVTSRPTSIWDIGARLPEHGVTAFLPTVVSSPAPAVRDALAVLAGGPPPDYRGARPLGLHCEGPMLAESRRGAHQARHLRSPSPDCIEGLSLAAGVRLVTLAPELPGAAQVIRALVERGVIVSAGHSDASFETAAQGFELGVTLGTHLFNGMRPFHHRDPGLAGALMARADVPAGLIVDGLHVHPGAVAVAWRAKGPDGIALATDAVAAMGIGTAPGVLGDVSLEVRSGVPRDPEGRLAGSLLSMDQAIRNVIAFTGCEPSEAIRSAAETPAEVLGETRRGAIAPGAEADLALLDEELRVVATFVGGAPVFDARGPAAHPGREVRRA